MFVYCALASNNTNNQLLNMALSGHKGVNGRLHHDASSEDGKTRRVYVNNNQDKAVLAVLCIGLNHFNGNLLLALANETWNAQPADVWKPLRYIAEVKRWEEIFNIRPHPKPDYWKMERLTSWVLDRPIQNPIFEETLRVKKSEKVGAPGYGEETKLGCGSFIVFWITTSVYNTCNATKLHAAQQLMHFPLPIALHQFTRWLPWYGMMPFWNPVTNLSNPHNNFLEQIDIGSYWERQVCHSLWGGFPSLPHWYEDKTCSKLQKLREKWPRGGLSIRWRG